MATNAAPTPTPNKATPATQVIAATLDEQVDGDAAAADPVSLFTADYDANNGRVSTISPRRAAATRKASDSPGKNAAAAAEASASKRSNVDKSPLRKAALAAGAAFVKAAGVAAPAPASAPGTAGVVPPPDVRRKDPSPTSILENVFDDQPAAKPETKKPSGGLAMFGLVPKSGFLNWMRDSKTAVTKFTDQMRKKDLRDRRADIMYHFDRKGKTRRSKSPGDDEAEGPVTRSSIAEDEDWIIDMDAANCEVADTRRLDRYALEHIFTLEAKTKLLLLVRVSDDEKLFGGKGAVAHEVQQLPTKKISGSEYYQLKCMLTDVTDHMQLTSGVGVTEPQFKKAFDRGTGGFDIQLEGAGKSFHMNWRQIILNPSVFMFFGPPLSMGRSFDNIFSKLTNLDSLHARFLVYYDEFEGDVNACLGLYNAYLQKRLAILEAMCKKKDKKSKNIDGGVFRSKKVRDFLKKFDKACEDKIEHVLCNFYNVLLVGALS